MFEFQGKAKLTSLNARAEIHGEARKPAFDLKFEAACPSEILIDFHPELRQMLFKKSEDPDLVEQADAEALTALRFPTMGSIKWAWKGVGYSVAVPYGLSGPSDIRLGECEVDDFKFAPQNGGTVIVTWRVICHPETADVGRLCEFIQQEIDGVKVTPPAPTTVQELFGEEKQAA